MAIERKVDNLGRIVLPKEMRDKFGIEENIPVEITSNEVSIIIKNPKAMKSKSEIKQRLKTEENEIVKETLEWVLNEKEI